MTVYCMVLIIDLAVIQLKRKEKKKEEMGKRRRSVKLTASAGAGVFALLEFSCETDMNGAASLAAWPEFAISKVGLGRSGLNLGGIVLSRSVSV